MASKNTTTNVSAFMKTMYPDSSLHDQMEDLKHLYKEVEKSDFNKYSYGGNEAKIFIRKGRIQGLGSTTEDGDLPDARSSLVANPTITLKYNYARAYVTNQQLEFAYGGSASAADYLTELSEDMVQSAMKKYNFDLFNTSDAWITQVNGAVTDDTSITVDSTAGLKLDQEIEIHNTLGTATVENVIITDIVDSTTITVDTRVTVSDNAYIINQGDYGNTINGLKDAISTTNTYHGIARTGNGYWQGNQVNTDSTTIADTHLSDLMKETQKYGKNPKFFLTTLDLYWSIWKNILKPQRQIDTATITGGMEVYKYHGLPIVWDNDCTSGYVYCVDPSIIKIFQSGSGWNWMDEDGSRFCRVSGKDSFEMLYRNYSNMIVTHPKGLPVVTGKS